MRERGGEGQVEALVGGFLGGADGDRGAEQDLAGPALGCVHELGGGHDLVDQTPLVRDGGGDVVAGQHVAHGDLERDVAREAVDTTGSGHQADSRLGQAEAGVVGGDDDVAGHRHLAAAAEGEAVDRGDHRLGALPVGGDSAEAALHRSKRGALVGRHPRHFGGVLQIVAGRECALAGAGQDSDPGGIVGGEGVPGVGQFLSGRRVNGVHPLGPVDGDGDDVAVLLVLDELVVGHAQTLQVVCV